MNDGSGVAVSYRLDGRIQHRVEQFSIWMRPDGPTDDLAIKAVGDEGEVHLAGRDLKLGDVSQPLLVRGCCPEVSIDKVFGRWADLPPDRSCIGAALAWRRPDFLVSSTAAPPSQRR